MSIHTLFSNEATRGPRAASTGHTSDAPLTSAPARAVGTAASVKLSDVGAFESIAALQRQGVAVEAVVSSAEEVDALSASRYGSRVTAVRIDLSQVPAAWSGGESAAIRASLRAHGFSAVSV